MFSPPIASLSLPSRLSHLSSSPLLASDVLLRPASELSSLLRLNEHDVAVLQHAAAEALAGAPEAVALAEEEGRLQTGDERMDALLGGGVQRGLLTEIVGESSSGKTQLLLQLAVHTALGLSSSSDAPSSSAQRPRPKWHAPLGVAYLSTSGLASASALVRRLVEISDAAVLASLRRSSRSSSSANSRSGSANGEHASGGSGSRATRQPRPSVYEAEEVELARERMLANVHLACVGDAEALEHALLYTLPALIHRCSSSSSSSTTNGVAASQQQRPAEIGLIIIDDLPALFHEDAAGTMLSLVARSRMLCELADRLKTLAYCGGRDEGASTSSSTSDPTPKQKRTEIAVVVVNHVSDVFERERALAVSSGRELLSHLSSSQGQGSHSISSLPRSLRTARAAGLDAPLAFVQQAAPISGLYATREALLDALRRGEDARGLEAASGRLKQAALGLPWVNGINVRLLLSRSTQRLPVSAQQGQAQQGEKKETQVGCATLLFSPCASADQQPVRFVIGAKGITSLAPLECDAR